MTLIDPKKINELVLSSNDNLTPTRKRFLADHLIAASPDERTAALEIYSESMPADELAFVRQILGLETPALAVLPKPESSPAEELNPSHKTSRRKKPRQPRFSQD